MSERQLTEAPGSVKIRTNSPGGYSVQVTIRDLDAGKLMPRSPNTLKWLQAQ